MTYPAPVDALPEPMRSLAAEGAAAIGCDPAMIAAPALAVAAGAIGRSLAVEVKEGWREHATLWTAVVAGSGSAKSPALDLVCEPARELSSELVRASLDERRACDEEEGDLPPILQLVVGDATTEAIGKALNDNPRGLVAVYDELGGWTGAFNCYRGGRRGPDAARWLACWSGGAWTVNRKAEDPVVVDRPCVSVTGCQPPEPLREALRGEHEHDGLAGRLLLVWPENEPGLWSERVVSEATRRRWRDLVRALHAIPFDGEPRVLPLSPEAKPAFTAFHDEAGRRAAETSGLSAAVWSKARAHAARLALIFAAVRVGGAGAALDGARVEGEDMARALAWIEYLVAETLRFFDSIGDDAEDEEHSLIELIRDEHGGSITPRELHARRARYRRGRAEPALQALVDRGIGRRTWGRVPDGGGQQSRSFELVEGASSASARRTRPPGGAVSAATATATGGRASCDPDPDDWPREVSAPITYDRDRGVVDYSANGGAA